MKIIFIIPGAGDSFYCGNCFRDNLQASALRKAGHDVIISPLYLPLKNELVKKTSPLFFPATTYYVAQKFFQKISMPRWMKRFLSSDFMLRFASSLSGTTSAKGMEGMTMSMIEGDETAFLKEADHLTNWLKHEKPDLIHISSTLLIGIAKAIKKQLDIPIVCSVLDEEVWIDSMKKEYAELAWNAIDANLQYVDTFITVSNYYKEYVHSKVPHLKDLRVIYPGVDLEKYKPADIVKKPTIGFFYRLNKLDGLDILAKAFVILKKKNSVPDLQLKIGGGYTSQDKKFIGRVKKILTSCIHDVEFVESYSTSSHIDFYQSITVLSVPLIFNEGFSIYTCEAFACGVPVVEPATGAFPEIIGEAGVLYNPNTPENLAEALEKLLSDPSTFDRAVKCAREKSSTLYNDATMVNELIKTYKTVI